MASSPFTIHNLPYGVVSFGDSSPRLAIAYKDYAIDISYLAASYPELHRNIPSWPKVLESLNKSVWNAFAALPSSTRQTFRTNLQSFLRYQDILSIDSTTKSAFLPLSQVTLHLPFDTRNYSDFYCSYEHAKNCSAIFNLNITPSWYSLPQVYNGRTSSIAVSGTPITRPCGIFPLSPDAAAAFQPETKLDFELEMGIWISNPVPRGQRLPISEARDHIFGVSLLNDWSARSIQFFEMQPLGPFHSKGSLTSISPWIVPIEALDAHAVSPHQTTQSPSPLAHLTWPAKEAETATWSIHVRATLVRDTKSYTLSESNINELHWTPLQQIAHLASAGEGLSPGDVFGTGTISSSRTNEAGEKIGLSCLWERRLEDARMAGLPGDLHETLLLDGDEIVLSAEVRDETTGSVIFGFGECKGRVLPAESVKEWER